MDVISTLGTWAGVAVSIAVGCIGLVIARRANRIATAALEEAERANEVAERSHALAELTTVTAVDPLSSVKHDSGVRFYVTNDTSRTVIVDSVDIDPGRPRTLVRGETGVLIGPNGSYPFIAARRNGLTSFNVVLRWHWDGDTEIHESIRSIPTPTK